MTRDPHMVIAHVLTSLDIGGGERVALELADGQRDAERRVIVVSLAADPDGPLADAFRARGVTIHHVPKRRNGVDPTLPFRLAVLFRKERVSVVHLHNRVPLIYGAAAGRAVGAVVVHTRHGPRRGTRRQQWLLRVAGRLLHAYVAVSPELLELAQTLGDCTADKLAVIENGIDLQRFGSAAGERGAVRDRLGIPAGAWVIGSVGRLAPEKEYPMLVRAAAPLLGPESRLVVVGDGTEKAAIQAELDAHQVGAFALLPGARDDIPQFLAALDVFVLSSSMEGLPLVVLEAMAAGRPVVATAVGGIPNLIEDGRTGFLVPVGDEQALRQRLTALRADPGLALMVGAHGQEHVRARYSREAMVQRYLALYDQVRVSN